MKIILLIAICMFSNNAFGARTLDCKTEDGSALKATVNSKAGSVPTQVRYSVRGNTFRKATVLKYISGKAFFNGSAQEEQIQTLAVRDAQTGELAAVVTNGSYIDKTGAYSVECSFVGNSP